ncbi:Transcription factor [Penicillium chermesinum]|nr:Transcription factor [Penicillium chermesinum]
MEHPSLTPGPIPVDEHNLKTGARALLVLKDLPLFRKLISTRYKMYEGYTLGKPIAYMVLNGMEEMWNPFTITPDMSWAEFASMANGRWEAVGLLMTIVGISTRSSIPPSQIEPPCADTDSIAVAAAGVGDLCLQFCDSAGVVNDIVCWLLLYHSMLLTIVYGDWDYRPWRKIGELTASVYTIGMHQESPDLPFFIRELRRRTMATAYTFDKALASFLGRPPLIPWRYCNFNMPLDLNTDEVVAEPSMRDAAIETLDEHGWNSNGYLDRGASVRVFLLTSISRERVLELSLDNRTEGFAERVEELSKQFSEQYRNMPAYLHWENRAQYEQPQVAGRFLVHDLYLEFLYNDFLLHRILAKRTNTQSERGVAISLEILNAIITATSSMHRIATWNLCNAGIPSAGVLCGELLRRSRSQMPYAYEFPRSEIIQKLSIFASHLETMVGPNEGNYQIAQQGQRAIRHVLDQILSAPNATPAPLTAPTPISDTDMSAGQEVLCAELLDNMDVGDRVQFLHWLDGRADTHEPWLTWMNFG